MNSAAFGNKQSHLSILKLYRTFTEPLGLTPARADMLRAIGSCDGRVAQSRLWKLLSVAKSVVSVMVRSLETLGFVTRFRSSEDRRTFNVSLTETGKQALRRIHFETNVEGFLGLALVAAFGPNWQSALQKMLKLAWPVRQAFGRYLEDPWEWDLDDEALYYAEVEGNPNRIDIVNTWEEDWAAGNPVTGDYTDDPTAPDDWRTHEPVVNGLAKKPLTAESSRERSQPDPPGPSDRSSDSDS